jgi:hypothetical protein
LATDARPAFIAITGRLESEARDAAARFAACLREASSEADAHEIVAECATLADRAFGGDDAAWAPLVAGVRRLLAGGAAATAGAVKSRRELHAFVAENADLLEGLGLAQT